MLRNVDRSRGVFTAEAPNTRFRTTCSIHLLIIKDKDKARDKDKDNDPSNHFRTGVGRRPTPTSKTGPLSKFRPDLPTNHPRTIGPEFI